MEELSPEEIKQLEKELKAEFKREEERPLWKKIEEFAQSVCAHDAPDPEAFKLMWESASGKPFTIEAYRWALKKSRTFRAHYSGCGPADFRITKRER